VLATLTIVARDNFLSIESKIQWLKRIKSDVDFLIQSLVALLPTRNDN
jgi:hypothetical protein